MPYEAKMLPQVDYQKIEIENEFYFSLTDLEYQTMQNCCDFLEEGLKPLLMKEYLIQTPELLVAHLCAYLGTVATVHTVHQAKALEPLIIDLVKREAKTAYQHFNKYPVNSTGRNHQQKEKNLEMLRQATPGSMVVQTMRLGRMVMDMLEELVRHRQHHFKTSHPPKQTELLCSQESLIKILLLISSKKCAQWRDSLAGLSDNYVINQLAIQIGWLIGYFSHLDNQTPDETQYFDYGLPFIEMYRKHIYQLMHAYASAKHAQEEADLPDDGEAETLLSEIRSLA